MMVENSVKIPCHIGCVFFLMFVSVFWVGFEGGKGEKKGSSWGDDDFGGGGSERGLKKWKEKVELGLVGNLDCMPIKALDMAQCMVPGPIMLSSQCINMHHGFQCQHNYLST